MKYPFLAIWWLIKYLFRHIERGWEWFCDTANPMWCLFWHFGHAWLQRSPFVGAIESWRVCTRCCKIEKMNPLYCPPKGDSPMMGNYTSPGRETKP